MNIEDRNWKEYAQKLEQRVEKLMGLISDPDLLEQHLNNLKDQNTKAENDEE